MLVSNLGYVYILDINNKELISIFELHKEKINSIIINKEHNYVATSGYFIYINRIINILIE